MDIIDRFLSLYVIGDKQEAFNFFLKNPELSYSALFEESAQEKSNPTHHGFLLNYLINFTDASAFGELIDWVSMVKALQIIWKLKDNEESIFHKNKLLELSFSDFIEKINQEESLLVALFSLLEAENLSDFPSRTVQNFFNDLMQGKEVTSDSLDSLLDEISSQFKEIIQNSVHSYEKWNKIVNIKPHLLSICSREDFYRRKPTECFAYEMQPNVLVFDETAEAYVIFLQPIQSLNYQEYLNGIIPEKPVIYACETFSIFCQLLVCEGFIESCSRRNVILYLLEEYPLSQFISQTSAWKEEKKIQFLFMLNEKSVEPYLEPINKALNVCLTQNESDFHLETPAYNWLYAIAKRLNSAIISLRYGADRAIGQRIKMGMQEWHNPHKGAPAKDVDLGPLPVNYFEEAMRNLKHDRRLLNPSEKIRLAHVVPQLLDGNHAPSNLIRTLCYFYDPIWFDTFVVSTERLGSFFLSYPHSHYISDSSSIRGKNTIDKLSSIGINTIISPEMMTYESEAVEIVKILESLQVDIVIFHGPDEMNYLISQLTFTPIRILFDHGTLPTLGCFDFVVLSSEDAYRLNGNRMRQLGMECCYLPYPSGMQKAWEVRLTSRTELGLPEEAFVMTTISNHLDSRLNLSFCQAIAKILRRCPHAIYAPMGLVRNQDRFDKIFTDLGVRDQVFFLGNQDNPSQIARSMHLYLNEFPFGSGLSILDAMAAGCPVVSMYNEEGPQQGRYGGSYFGIDRVIHSGNVNDYIDLAVSLVNDPEKYSEWSRYASEKYERQADVEEYSQKFEKILEYFVEHTRSIQGQQISGGSSD